MNDFMRIGRGVNNINNFWDVKSASAKKDKELNKFLEGQLNIKPGMTERDYLEVIDRLVRFEINDTAKKTLIEKMKKIVLENFNNEKWLHAKLQLAQGRLNGKCLKEANNLSSPHTLPQELDGILKTIDFGDIKEAFGKLKQVIPERLEQCYNELCAIRDEAERIRTAYNLYDVFSGKDGKSAEEILRDRTSGKTVDITLSFTNKLKEFTDIVGDLISKYKDRISIYNNAYLKLDSYIANA